MSSFLSEFNVAIQSLSAGLGNFLNQWKESLGVAPGGGGGGGGGGVNVEFFHATTVLFNSSVNLFDNRVTEFSNAVNTLVGSSISLELPTGININLVGADMLQNLQSGLKQWVFDQITLEINKYKAIDGGLGLKDEN